MKKYQSINSKLKTHNVDESEITTVHKHNIFDKFANKNFETNNKFLILSQLIACVQISPGLPYNV